MFKCEECGKIFEEPKKIPAERFYGVESLFEYNFGKEINVCPFCEGSIVECEEEIEEDEEDEQ